MLQARPVYKSVFIFVSFFHIIYTFIIIRSAQQNNILLYPVLFFLMILFIIMIDLFTQEQKKNVFLFSLF
jgi:hypothetical protein